MPDFFLTRPDETAFATLIGEIAQSLSAKGLTLATAESCTGGLMAALCTDMAGSSAWFTGGVVAYSNTIKERVLGVPAAVLERYGAVSGPVVEHMARGALGVCGAAVAVAVSGVAGPDGGSAEKPVGTVWIGWALRNGARGATTSHAERFLFPGNRAAVRAASAERGLAGVLKVIA